MRPGQTILVKTNATNGELQRAIEAAIPQATKQAATFADRYKGKNEWETCKKIFDYLKNNINYKADGANQQVRLPSGLMRTKQGDCKSYSVFTSAVLSNLGIPHKLVYASYDPKDPTPSHIYVMTDCGYIVDAVYGKFNAEKKATFKKYKPMNISYIAGVKPRRKIGRSCGYSGIGATEGAFEWASRNGINLSAGQKIAIGAQKVLPMAIGGRSIVRNLIQKNAGGFATSLNKLMIESRSQRPGQTSWDKMRSIELNWLNKGGNPNELYESIAEGASKTPTGAYFNKLMKMKAGGYSPNPAQWIAAAVSALFGKKYNESTGAISGEPVSTTAVVVTTAPWWATTVAGIVTTLGVAYITSNVNAAPGEDITTDNTTNNNTGGAAPRSSALLPILLIGGAAAAYFILKPAKK
jgi:hypothetical protein